MAFHMERMIGRPTDRGGRIATGQSVRHLVDVGHHRTAVLPYRQIWREFDERNDRQTVGSSPEPTGIASDVLNDDRPCRAHDRMYEVDYHAQCQGLPARNCPLQDVEYRDALAFYPLLKRRCDRAGWRRVGFQPRSADQRVDVSGHVEVQYAPCDLSMRPPGNGN